MFSDLPVDPAARAERQRKQERNELVKLRDRLRPRSVGTDSTTGEFVCFCSGACALVTCGLLAVVLFVLVANDGGILIYALIDLLPSTANATGFSFNVTNATA